MKNTIYMIVGKGFTKYVVTEEEKAEFVKAASKYTAFESLRPELDCQPIFNGLAGPMWDGERIIVNGELKYTFDCTAAEKATCERVSVVRYESYEAYDALSR